MDFQKEADNIQEEQESDNLRIEDQNQSNKDAQTQDGNQIIKLDINKRNIEQELEAANKKRDQMYQFELSAVPIMNSDKIQGNFEKCGLYEDNDQQQFYQVVLFYLKLCEYVFEEQQYQSYFQVFKQCFEILILQIEEIEEIYINLLNLAIVMKLNFEKLPKTINQNLIYQLYNKYKDRIKEVLNCNYEERETIRDMNNCQKFEFINRFKQNQEKPSKIRNKKLLGIDDSINVLQLFNIFCNVEKLNQNFYFILDKCNEVQNKLKQIIQKEKEDKTYKKKLKKFFNKKLVEGFMKKQYQNPIYNIVYKYLVKSKSQNSVLILWNLFVEKKYNWINLLDFKNKDYETLFTQITKFIDYENIQSILPDDCKQYFKKQTYRKFDFLELLIQLLSIFQIIKIYPHRQEELYNIIEEICFMKRKRYLQKKQIVFSGKDFKILISSSVAKVEVENAIDEILRDPQKFIEEAEFKNNSFKIKKFLKKLKKKTTNAQN
ncbi:unnamed protein product [Paramecium octaurelia]|uniref:Uncharacterized protein n=1 Tax=Paramecium octaurelia TaxID=43137 RepID=A0A8S1WW66_PAROT|nr:unnamed protein product [Paramecium octaurelia]